MKEVLVKEARTKAASIKENAKRLQHSAEKKLISMHIGTADSVKPANPGDEKRNLKGLLDENQNTQYPFFTEKAFLDMALGKIPDFAQLYQSLSEIKVQVRVPLSAIQFLPALRHFTLTDAKEIQNFMDNPETNHVLVQNEQIKIVLIRWNPGDESKIHGHAEGGCVFKVLYGKIIEKRFSADREQRLIAEASYSKENIAYIDDIMGLHRVGNPYSEPAITLHMYTPGNYSMKKK